MNTEGIKMQVEKAYGILRGKVSSLVKKTKEYTKVAYAKAIRGLLKAKWGIGKVSIRVKKVKLPKRGIKVPYKSGLSKSADTVLALQIRVEKQLRDGTVTVIELKAILNHLNTIKDFLRVDYLIIRIDSYIKAWENLETSDTTEATV